MSGSTPSIHLRQYHYPVIFLVVTTNLEELLDSTEGWAGCAMAFSRCDRLSRRACSSCGRSNRAGPSEGKFFGEIADELRLDPVEAYLTIARESGTRARVLNHLYSATIATRKRSAPR